MIIIKKLTKKLFAIKRAADKSIELIPFVSIGSIPALLFFTCIFPFSRALEISAKIPFGISIQICHFGRSASYVVRSYYDVVVLYEMFAELQYDTQFTPTPNTIIDLGSNSGASIIFFKLKYPKAKIYGFEPDPSVFKSLQVNTKQFGNDVVLSQKLVSDKSDISYFYSNPEGISSSIFERSAKSRKIEIETETLDNILEKVPQDSCILVKFDVEGSEEKIFKASTKLSRIDHFIGEFHKDLLPDQSEETFGSYFPLHLIQYQTVSKERSIIWGSLLKYGQTK